jgi:hypothetical protein
MDLHEPLLKRRSENPGMEKRHGIAVAVAALCLAVAGRGETSGPSGIESRYRAFAELAQDVAMRPQIEQEPTMRARFERTLAHAYTQDDLQRASDADLRFLVRAGEDLGFFSYSKADLPYVARPLGVLEQRGAASDADRARYFRALIGLRLFDQARAYRATYPSMDVEPVPDIAEASGAGSGPPVYAIGEGGLARMRLSIDAGVHVVVVAHPLCAYSRKAMEQLAGDAHLSPFLRERATWLAPVSRRIGLDVLQAWNDANAATPLVLADRREDWPFIRTWSTPTFHVLKDGLLVGTFEGWPAEGRRPQLVALLRAAGVEVE